MRRYIASSSNSANIYTVSREMKRLRDVMDAVPSDMLNMYGLDALYEELLDCIQDLEYQIYPDTDY